MEKRLVNQKFMRARSDENKSIRMQQIMSATDTLFHEHTYHEISLSVISEAVGIARGGLYKYVSSKEEIFMFLYLQKQQEILEDMLEQLRDRDMSISRLAEVMSRTLYRHLDFLKYHQIQNAIVETNVPIERLAEFKKDSLRQRKELFTIITDTCSTNENQAYDAYLAILAHGVYLRDRMNCTDRFMKAMELAGLEIVRVEFEENLRHFINMYLTYCVASHDGLPEQTTS